MATTEERIIKVITRHLNVDAEATTVHRTFADLNGDSLDCVEILMYVEDEFERELVDELTPKLDETLHTFILRIKPIVERS